MKNPKQLTDAILESVGKKGDPIGILVEAVLEKWEAEIRMDQLKKDQAMVSKVVSETFQSND